MAAWVFLRFDFTNEVAFGPSRAAILRAIEKCGSLTAAADAVGLTYRQVWSAVQAMNEGFGEIVVVKRGRHSGGASLTLKGEKLLKRYLEMEAAFYEVFAKDLRYIEKLVGEDSASPIPVPRWARVLDDNPPGPGTGKKSSQKKRA
jgi:molybdate transport system regulatory protein